MLKDTFNTCGKSSDSWRVLGKISLFDIMLTNFIFVPRSAGMVQYADIKMENGKSKGCGVVRFDTPETAERVCRTMNGYRLNGREIDVRIDRNA